MKLFFSLALCPVVLCGFQTSGPAQQDAGGPLKVAVAVVVVNPAVAVPAGWTVLHGAKGIATPDFNFGENLSSDFIAAMADDKRVQCVQLESSSPPAPLGTVKSHKPTPAKGIDRTLQIDVEVIQAIKIKLTPNTEFEISGKISMVDKNGAETWSNWYTEKVKVKGNMEDFLKDNQQGLKQALNRLIEHFVVKKTADLKKRKNL